MTQKVITITYAFDKHGNPENINLNVNGDNLLVEDDRYLKQFTQYVENQNKVTDDMHAKNNGLKLVKN